MENSATDIELKHSGFGITSLLVSFISFLLMFAVFIFAAELSRSEKVDESFKVMVIAIPMLICIFMQIIALGFAVSGLFQKERKKITAFIGGATSLGTILLVVIFAAF